MREVGTSLVSLMETKFKDVMSTEERQHVAKCENCVGCYISISIVIGNNIRADSFNLLQVLWGTTLSTLELVVNGMDRKYLSSKVSD